VPRSHRAHEQARVAAARALSSAGRFPDAVTQLRTAGLDEREEAEVLIDIYERALTALASGTVAPDRQQRVGEFPLDADGMRRGLEVTCRRLAGFTPDRATRYRLIDRANRVRPLTVL
jgi:serine/threonine-protein kinase PknG